MNILHSIPPVRHGRTTSLYEREVLSLPLSRSGGKHSLTDGVSAIIPPLACKGRQMLASVGIIPFFSFALALVFSPMVFAISLTLNLNGAAPDVYTTTTSSSTITIPSTIVDFDNLTITSWNTCPDGTGTTYHKGDTLATSTTLYAQWSNGLHISDTVSGCGATDSDDNSNDDNNSNANANTNTNGGGTSTNTNTNGNSSFNSNSSSDTSGGNANGSSNSNSSSSGSTSNASTSTGSPSAGYASLPSKLTMPISFILAGMLAIVAVLKLTKKEVNSSPHPASLRSATFPIKGKAKAIKPAVLTIAAISLVTGTFFLAKTISNAADSTNIYAGYEGYFTVGETMASGETTWWKDGVKQSGQSSRNGKWHWFETDDTKLMALDKEVYINSDHNNGDDGKWVRYDANGDMVYGWYKEAQSDSHPSGRWLYYDTDSGEMLKGEQYLPEDNNEGATKHWYYFEDDDGSVYYGWKTLSDGRTVHYHDESGIMDHGWTTINEDGIDNDYYFNTDGGGVEASTVRAFTGDDTDDKSYFRSAYGIPSQIGSSTEWFVDIDLSNTRINVSKYIDGKWGFVGSFYAAMGYRDVDSNNNVGSGSMSRTGLGQQPSEWTVKQKSAVAAGTGQNWCTSYIVTSGGEQCIHSDNTNPTKWNGVYKGKYNTTGCPVLSDDNAKWIYDHVPLGTKVYIHW